ncbi:unnamed protein product [Protopolystoma xenopodis]|uniref:Uncharacterized protein n=1 Tax=Protopolystoma xenopodis TaxID=117903 RepID=A0A3S5AEG4_9PLAT|nr:unnamed protein product [Protopolystoma xenopodis]
MLEPPTNLIHDPPSYNCTPLSSQSERRDLLSATVTARKWTIFLTHFYCPRHALSRPRENWKIPGQMTGQVTGSRQARAKPGITKSQKCLSYEYPLKGPHLPWQQGVADAPAVEQMESVKVGCGHLPIVQFEAVASSNERMCLETNRELRG